MKDILERLADSHLNEGSHDLQCRCFDAAEEISRLRVQRDELLAALKACESALRLVERETGKSYAAAINARAAIAKHEPKP